MSDESAQENIQKIIQKIIQKSIFSHGAHGAHGAHEAHGKFSSEVIVHTDDEIHFEVVVISDVFQNQSRVKRHQLVYADLSQKIMDGKIHAVALKTYTPEEWANLEDKKNE